MTAYGPGLVELPDALPAGVVVEPLEGALTVAGRREAHVALPRQRLDQRARALVEDRAQVAVGPCA